MLVAIAVPFLIPCFVPILAVFWWVRRRYVTTSREVKRYEGTTRSPVYSSFSAAVKVLVLVHAKHQTGSMFIGTRIRLRLLLLHRRRQGRLLPWVHRKHPKTEHGQGVCAVSLVYSSFLSL